MQRTSFTIVILVSAILLSACGASSGEEYESFTFTAEDAAEITALLDQIEEDQQEQGTSPDILTSTKAVVLDVSKNPVFNTLRSKQVSEGSETFRVTNTFVNVRSEPSVRGGMIEELDKGDSVKLLSFIDASWAHIEMQDGRKGYVSTSYIAQVATDDELPIIRQKYEGKYFVDFRFLNVRSQPSGQGQKLGELVANQIVEPIAFHDDWARIQFEGQEAFVSSQYLRPFSPSIVVRQERFRVPVLRYSGEDEGVTALLLRHLEILKSGGKRVMTLQGFYELLLEQEERDVRMSGDIVILTVGELDKQSLSDIVDVLRASSVSATLFIRSALIGPDQIASSVLQSLSQNGGIDIQSGGHTGDDLRALTNDQVTAELAQSKQILEDVTGKDVFAVAYPIGGSNERVAERAMATGYLFGLTTAPPSAEGFTRQQFLQLPASVVSSQESEAVFRSIVGL